MVYKIANGFFGEKEDLYQAGFLGLLKAYKNYNKQSKTKFSTYAFPYIYGEIYEESNKGLIKVNKKNLKLYKQYLDIESYLTQKLSREVSPYEVCNYLKQDYSKIFSIMHSLNCINSLEDYNSLFYLNNIDDLILIKDSLKKLNYMERQVVKEIYFYDKNQNEIAKKYGISQVKVSRTLKLGKNKIKKYISC